MKARMTQHSRSSSLSSTPIQRLLPLTTSWLVRMWRWDGWPKLNPQFERAKTELAALSGQKPDETKQIEQMQAALQADPKNVQVREALARALLRKNQVKEAQVELKKLLDQNPGHAEANYLMAQILFQQGNADEAANHLRATLRANPSHVRAHALLGRYLELKGQLEQALAEYEAALRVNPNLP